MSGPIRLFVGSYPEFYDRLLVPVLFAPYARLLADRLRGMTVGNVLEIAAGTGVVTRALVHTLPEAVNITATDLNPPMLDRARSHAGMDRVSDGSGRPLGQPADKPSGAIPPTDGREPTPDEIAEINAAADRRHDGDSAAAVGMVSILGDVIVGGLPVPCSQAGRR